MLGNWVDMTSISDCHQIEFNLNTGEYRHRPLNINRAFKRDIFSMEELGTGPWLPGLPWHSVHSIPVGKVVEVRTVKGIVCPARTRNKSARWIRRADRWGPDRVNCLRADKPGDVVAVEWR